MSRSASPTVKSGVPPGWGMPAAAKISRLKKRKKDDAHEISYMHVLEVLVSHQKDTDFRKTTHSASFIKNNEADICSPSLLRAEVHRLTTGFEEAKAEGMGQVIAGIRSSINGEACS